MSDDKFESEYEQACLDIIRSFPYTQTPENIIEFLKNNGMALKYVKNPTERMIKTAIKNNKKAIQFVENPSEKDIDFVLSGFDKVDIKLIKNPSLKFLVKASRPSNIKEMLKDVDFSKLTDMEIDELIKINPYVI